MGLEREQNELDAELQRIGIRNDLRAAVRSEQFDKINNEEEMAAFLQERDNGHLLRDREKDDLIDGYKHRKH